MKFPFTNLFLEVINQTIFWLLKGSFFPRTKGGSGTKLGKDFIELLMRRNIFYFALESACFQIKSMYFKDQNTLRILSIHMWCLPK